MAVLKVARPVTDAREKLLRGTTAEVGPVFEFRLTKKIVDVDDHPDHDYLQALGDPTEELPRFLSSPSMSYAEW